MKKMNLLAVIPALLLLASCGSPPAVPEPEPASAFGTEASASAPADMLSASPSAEPSVSPAEADAPEDATEAPPSPAEASEPSEEALPAEPSEPSEEPAPEAEAEGLGQLADSGLPPTDAPALITVLTPEAPGTLAEENGSAVIDYSNAGDGYIMAAWRAGGDARVKVLLTGPSGTRYQYDLNTEGRYEAFPLSDGSGDYTVGVYRNTSGTSYATILSTVIQAALTDEFAPFLRPNQYISFTEDSQAVQKAAALCAGLTDNLDKVRAVYEYVVNNVTYDHEKADTVQSGYLPDVDETLSTGRGICFDYAALMTAMLRSQNVPAKLIVGYTGEVYHAWISVYSETDGWLDAAIYFNGREWKLMDPTFAASSGQSDEIMSYIGNGANYTAKYQY